MFAAGDQAECYLLGMVKNVVDLAFAGDPHPYETAKAQLIAKRRRVLFPAPEPLAFRIPVTAVERDGPIVIPRRLDAVDGRSGLPGGHVNPALPRISLGQEMASSV